MKIGLYNPFLTDRGGGLGGGDRYLLTILAEAVRLPGAEVTLFAPDEPHPEEWARIGISVPASSFAAVRADDEAVTRASADLDLLIVMTCDVPPLSRARRSVAMVQFPFVARERAAARAREALARALGLARAPAALASYGLFLCNSEFSRDWIRRRLGVEAVVIPPPVDPPRLPPGPKGTAILGVGRFFRGFHNKKHDVLIRAFRELLALIGDDLGWELHLAGSAGGDPSARAYLAELRAQAEGLPVRFHVDAPAAELDALYATSMLFWHATGFGEDPQRHPERLEHFGMATVEAMMHGAVPLVYPEGGQREIVTDGVDGVHWRTTTELAERSAALIGEPQARELLAARARESAARFGTERFVAAVRERVLRARA